MEVNGHHDAQTALPTHPSPREIAHGTHWIGGWVGHRASLDTVVKRKIPCLCRESNSSRPAHSLVTTLTELQGLQGYKFKLETRNKHSSISAHKYKNQWFSGENNTTRYRWILYQRHKQ